MGFINVQSKISVSVYYILSVKGASIDQRMLGNVFFNPITRVFLINAYTGVGGSKSPDSVKSITGRETLCKHNPGSLRPPRMIGLSVEQFNLVSDFL